MSVLNPYGNEQIKVSEFIEFARKRGAQRLEDLREYVETLNRDGPKLGLSPSLAVAQSLHECADRETASKVYVSVPWTYGLNPAGIGVESDALWRVYDFKTGEHAARVQLLQLHIYFLGITLPEGFSSSESPRWPVTIAARPSRIASTTTVAGLSGTWATDKQYAEGIQKWYDRMLAAGIFRETEETPAEGGQMADKVTFGRVPVFGYVDRQAVTASKPEGVGWDNLGQRDVLGVVLHRMLGSLVGTDQFFGLASTGALTDYGIGVAAQDGSKLDGVIYRWNNEYGYRSGWASGRVSAPYGDGLLFVNKYGVNAVNKRLVSLEISGFEGTPITDFARGEIVHFIAYYADKAKISWEDFPLNKATGMSFVFWHQEFTIGTGKLCPFDYVMSITNQIIKEVQALLKKYQTAASGDGTGGDTTIPGGDVVIPKPTYATPVPIPELALLADSDFAGRKPYRDVKLANGKTLRARIVLDKVKVVNAKGFFKQYAADGSKTTKPDPKVGDLVDVIYSFTGDDGREYYSDGQWARIAQDDVLLFED